MTDAQDRQNPVRTTPTVQPRRPRWVLSSFFTSAICAVWMVVMLFARLIASALLPLWVSAFAMTIAPVWCVIIPDRNSLAARDTALQRYTMPYVHVRC